MFTEKKYYYSIDEFTKYGVEAIFTKKTAGNMADYIGKNGKNNRDKILKLINFENKKIVHALQKHTNRVEYIEKLKDLENLTDIDGFVTKSKEFVIFTYYADCLPIYILDKNQKAIGLAHSGWIGTYNDMIKSLIDKMVLEFNSKKEDLLIALGIGISQEDYEVGEEFYIKFKERFPNLYNDVFINIDGKYYYDNTKMNHLLALENGVLKENIFIDNRGVKNAKTFSHRLDKENVGRSAAIILIKE